jgi:hypothetical protein
MMPIRNRLLVTTNQHFKSHSCHLSYVIILLNSLNLNSVWSLVSPTHGRTSRLLSTLSQLCSESTVQGHISISLAECSHSETTAAWFFWGAWREGVRGHSLIVAPNLPAHSLKSCKPGWEIAHKRHTINKTGEPGNVLINIYLQFHENCAYRKEIFN